MLDLEKFAKLPLLGILRGLRQSDLAGIVEICRLCGLETIEVALNTPGAAEQIRELAERGRKAGLAVGAGTVLDALQLKQALDSGAGGSGHHEGVDSVGKGKTIEIDEVIQGAKLLAEHLGYRPSVLKRT